MLNLDVSQGQTAGLYPRIWKFQNYLSEVRAKIPWLSILMTWGNFYLKNTLSKHFFYFSSTIEAPLHPLQDACIVDFIEQNEFDDFKFDCHYIQLWNLWNIAPIYFFELISRNSEPNIRLKSSFDYQDDLVFFNLMI